jgi:hypothetical protein
MGDTSWKKGTRLVEKRSTSCGKRDTSWKTRGSLRLLEQISIL